MLNLARNDGPMKNNIDKFDILVGKILAKLYNEFPINSTLLSEEFGIKDNIAEFLGDEASQNIKENNELIFFESSIAWLIQNDIINAKNSGYGAYYDAALSFKGLKLLKVVPSSVNNERKSIGESLSELVKAGANEGIKKLVNIMIAYASAKAKEFLG